MFLTIKKVKVAHTERRVPELIPVLGSQPAGDVSHKPGSRLPLLSARHAVTPATIGVARIFDWGSWKFSPLPSFTLDDISHI